MMQTNITYLVPDFPREIAIPYRIRVETKKQFNDLVNLYNGPTKVWYSVYNLSTRLVDKIFLDFDNENCYQNVLKVHDYCMKNNFEHTVVCSGGGYHIYISAVPQPEKNQKSLLLSTHISLASDLGMKFGVAKEADMDRAIKGNIAQMCGLPGTYNPKRRRWCLSLPENMIDKGDETIKKYCEQKREGMFKIYLIGNQKMALNGKFNNCDYSTGNDFSDIPKDYAVNMDIGDETLQKICPPCIIEMLVKRGCWESRYYAPLYLKEKGLPSEKIDEIARKYFSRFKRTDNLKTNYDHFKKNGVLKTIFRRGDFFPNCETLYGKGFCPGKCPFYPLEKRLYAKH